MATGLSSARSEWRRSTDVLWSASSGVTRGGGGGGFGCSNTPLSVQLINCSLLIRLTEVLVQAAPG